MPSLSRQILNAAADCGIDAKGKSAAAIYAEHQANKDPRFWDQFDALLDELLGQVFTSMTACNPLD